MDNETTHVCVARDGVILCITEHRKKGWPTHRSYCATGHPFSLCFLDLNTNNNIWIYIISLYITKVRKADMIVVNRSEGRSKGNTEDD